MKYKDPQNKIHHLDSAEFEHLLPAGCVPITDAEAEALAPEATIAPPPTIEDRKQGIDSAISNSEPLRLILEAIEDVQGLPKGKLISDAKAKVK